MMTAMVSPMARPTPQHDGGHDAGGGRRGTTTLEHRALVVDAEGQGTLVVASGHGVEGALRHGDDGGQDHDAQIRLSRQHRKPRARPEQLRTKGTMMTRPKKP